MTTQEELVEFIKDNIKSIQDRINREGCIDDDIYSEINTLLYRLLNDWDEDIEII